MIQKAEVDTTIEDIHQIRARLAEKFGGDIKAILKDTRKRQAFSEHPTWKGAQANKAMQQSLPESSANENELVDE